MGLNAAILDYHVDASKPMGISMEIQLSAAEDGLAAIRYLRSHADEYGIPTDKIAIGGFSAGGILNGWRIKDSESRKIRKRLLY